MKHSTILMLEQDEDDRYITQALFDENKCTAKIRFVYDSTEFISCIEGYKDAELPALIILNQHSVPLNAVELLRFLKSNERFAHIPVIVLSGSKNTDMIRECYAAGASSFIQKPHSNEDTMNKVNSFIQYWFQTVEVAKASQFGSSSKSS